MNSYSVEFLFESRTVDPDEQMLENVLGFALRSLYGIIGSGLIDFEIVNINSRSNEIIIECSEEHIQKISSAVALVGSYGASRVKGSVSKINSLSKG